MTLSGVIPSCWLSLRCDLYLHTLTQTTFLSSVSSLVELACFFYSWSLRRKLWFLRYIVLCHQRGYPCFLHWKGWALYSLVTGSLRSFSTRSLVLSLSLPSSFGCYLQSEMVSFSTAYHLFPWCFFIVATSPRSRPDQAFLFGTCGLWSSLSWLCAWEPLLQGQNGWSWGPVSMHTASKQVHLCPLGDGVRPACVHLV